jgi:hypothetical protein
MSAAICDDMLEHLFIVLSVHSPFTQKEIKTAYDQCGSIDVIISLINYASINACSLSFALKMRNEIRIEIGEKE